MDDVEIHNIWRKTDKFGVHWFWSDSCVIHIMQIRNPEKMRMHAHLPTMVDNITARQCEQFENLICFEQIREFRSAIECIDWAPQWNLKHERMKKRHMKYERIINCIDMKIASTAKNAISHSAEKHASYILISIENLQMRTCTRLKSIKMDVLLAAVAFRKSERQVF